MVCTGNILLLFIMVNKMLEEEAVIMFPSCNYREQLSDRMNIVNVPRSISNCFLHYVSSEEGEEGLKTLWILLTLILKFQEQLW